MAITPPAGYTANIGPYFIQQSSLTVSYSLPAGTDRLVAIILHDRTSATLNSLTFNGSPCTLAHENANSSTWARIYYFLPGALAAGTYDVVATWSSDLFSGGITVMTLEGVDQASPVGAVGLRDINTPSTVSISYSTLAADSLNLMACTVKHGDGAPFTPGSGMTEIYDGASAVTASDVAYWAGYRITGAAGSYTFAVTPNQAGTAAVQQAGVAVEFRSSGGGGSPPVVIGGAALMIPIL